MITLIEALNYRCLRYVKQPLEPFQVLVGPNASGKTTFLDIVAFLGRLASKGLDAALENLTPNFEDLLFYRTGNRIELAIEARIPEKLKQNFIREREFNVIRYEAAICYSPEDLISNEVIIFEETVLLMNCAQNKTQERFLFPRSIQHPESILTSKRLQTTKTIISKVYGGKDNFYPEVSKGAGTGGWIPSFQLGPRKSALANLPEDETRFPASTWLKGLLSEGVQQIVLDSLKMRKASPPGQPRTFKTDGSNLPWVVENLKQSDSERFRGWISHLQTALPDLVDIRTIEREDDKHRYLMLRYQGDLEVPSWTASDGTLRLLALTLPAYLPDLTGVFLIEEPENGIHPRAVETMFQSLSHVYDAQVLMATHSPVILSMAEPHQVLCFAKNEEGATDIVPGNEHPSLADWQGETNLGALFAAGVLDYGESVRQ